MRKFSILALVLSVLFVVGFTGYRGYHVWKQHRLMTQARQFLQKQEPRNALLCLQQALRSNPNNLEACRLMADFAELARSPQAIYWRGRIVDLEPAAVTNRLNWARTAMAMGDIPLARKALASVPAEATNNAAFQKTAGAVAVAAVQYSEAEIHFQQAARLEPANPVPRLNLAVLNLAKKDPQAVAEGRTTLEQLKTNAAVRSEVLRHLTSDALRHSQIDSALATANELLRQTNVAFSDRLLHLEVLRQGKRPLLITSLAALQQDVRTNTAQVYELSKWMLSGGSPQSVLTWLQTLPATTQTNMPIPLITAEAYLAGRDWSGLLALLEPLQWDELESLRLAYRTRAFRELKQDAAVRGEWLRAMRATDNRLESLSLLLRTVTAWQWAQEQEDILSAIVNRYPAEKWAVEGLSNLLYATGKTRSLLALYNRMAEKEPDNFALKNNVASVGMLLDARDRRPHELAREVYDKANDNPFFASTYAFSLYLQEKPDDALRVFGQMKTNYLEHPSIAGYYGLALKAAGQAAQAKRYLTAASQARLLPEEKELFSRASR